MKRNESFRLKVCTCMLALAGAGGLQAADRQMERAPTSPIQTVDRNDLAGLPGPVTDILKLLDRPEGIQNVPLTQDKQLLATFGGEARIRGERVRNWEFDNQQDDTYGLTRLLPKVEIEKIGGPGFVFEGIGAWAFGRDLSLSVGGSGADDIHANSFDVHQAYLKIPLPEFGSSLGGLLSEKTRTQISVGRQELELGSGRLLGPDRWLNNPFNFDGVRIDLTDEDSGITLSPFWFKQVEFNKYNFDETESGSELYGIHSTIELSMMPLSRLDLYFYGTDRKDADFNATTGREERYTFGSRLSGDYSDNKIRYDLELAMQTGRVGSDRVSDAWMFSTLLSYPLQGMSGRPEFRLGFDYASGDNAAGGRVNTFNQLFPNGHHYLGAMDFIGRQNVIAFNTGVTVQPTDRLTCSLDAHAFWRADTRDAIYNPLGDPLIAGGATNERHIGLEFDLLFLYQLTSTTQLHLGYSVFCNGEAVSDAPGFAKRSDYFYFGAETVW